MGMFTRKKEDISTGYVTKQVDGAEVFVVMWVAHNIDEGQIRLRPYIKAKAFLREEDAKAFKKSLYNSLKLLQFVKDDEEAQLMLGVKIEKQA